MFTPPPTHPNLHLHFWSSGVPCVVPTSAKGWCHWTLPERLRPHQSDGIFWREKRGKGRKSARTRVTVAKVKNIVGRVALELLNLWNIPIPLQSRWRPLSKKWRNYWIWLEFFQWGQHLQLLLIFLVTSSPNLHHPRPLWSASLSVHVAWSDES